MPPPRRDEPSVDTIHALPFAADANTAGLQRTAQSTPTVESNASPQTELNLPFRTSYPSAASLYASTLSPPGSRPLSPARQDSPRGALSEPVFDTSAGKSISDGITDRPGEPLNLLTQAIVPHISVYASTDTEDLVKAKGFRNGLWELLRPFGDNVQGKVTVRDSNGISRSFHDFSVRFTNFGDNIEHPGPSASNNQQSQSVESSNGTQESTIKDSTALAKVENVVERHLAFAESSTLRIPLDPKTVAQGLNHDTTSPYYSLYLRRLLSGIPITPHETFAHPVACIMAISSRNDTPIEELRKLYADSNQSEKRLPPWVDSDYLRYYILVHDEENDDITRSMSLFEQMKRHLGLHCHLLRLRCSKSAETDDDSIPLPDSNWISAEEELARICDSEEKEGFESPTRYIFESDATAIRTFIREMVTQSIIPTMERHISIWNDQVASRRRGITGRFMNLSRKWAGFGSSSRSSSGGSISSKDHYDGTGFYHADAAESIMRRLADYAFMLRDWKLAHSTYELLRSDFSEAKAWKYHAAANEMAALSLLISSQNLTPKSRSESVDQMLEAAFYSYNTRCGAALNAVRCLLLGHELLKLRGGSNFDDASRWGIRLLESKILAPVGDALLKERLCICYASKTGVGSWNWGSRDRKAAAWSVFAAESWWQQQKYLPAHRCLFEARKIYDASRSSQGIDQFSFASQYMVSFQQSLGERLRYGNDHDDDIAGQGQLEGIDVESEAFTGAQAKRMSTVGRTGVLETAPLRGDFVD